MLTIYKSPSIHNSPAWPIIYESPTICKSLAWPKVYEDPPNYMSQARPALLRQASMSAFPWVHCIQERIPLGLGKQGAPYILHGLHTCCSSLHSEHALRPCTPAPTPLALPYPFPTPPPPKPATLPHCYPTYPHLHPHLPAHTLRPTALQTCSRIHTAIQAASCVARRKRGVVWNRTKNNASVLEC